LKRVLFILCCIWFNSVSLLYSQVNYHFSATPTTYQPVVNGNIVSLNSFFSSGVNATDEGFANSIPIGFNFIYNNNQTVSSVNVCTNGFVVLGAAFQDGSISAQDGYYINNLYAGPSSYSSTTGLVKSGHTEQRSILAPFWGDLDVQQQSNLVYKTTGIAPNRVFTIEWKNIKWDYQCNAAIGSFELKLYETSNIIEYAYNNLNGTPSASAKASIGLTNKSVGLNSFISLQGNYATPSVSSFLENSNITSFPSTGLVYRFVPHAAFQHNLSLSTLYHPGTICKNGEKYSFSVNVFNSGTQTAHNFPVTLSVDGNNTFSAVKYIESLAPGDSVTVYFDAFTPEVISTDTLKVLLPSDDDLLDNKIQKAIKITNNLFSNISLENNLYADNGVGNNVPAEFTTLFRTQNYKNINQISLYFSNESNNAPFDITVYDADVLDNKPGAIVWQQKGLYSFPGIYTINVTPGITVRGQYFIAVKQTSNTNINLAYEAESPLQSNTYYYRTPLNSNWIDISADNNTYKLLMGVQYDNTLPVTSTRFTGNKVADKNVLKWTTYTEINNDHFVVERSTNGHDFVTITNINTQSTNGNSNTLLSYTFTDDNTLPVNTYYRLRQVDKQSNYALSDVVMLKGDGKIPFALNNVFPNPVTSMLKVNYSSPSDGVNNIILFDATGKIVKQMTANSNQGVNEQPLNLGDIKNGQYFLQLINSAGKTNVISILKK